MQRYRCKIEKRRTFSLLPDCLLPYHGFRVGDILRWLYAMLVKRIGASTLALQVSRPRKTLADLKNKFLGVLNRLRLPGRAGALDPPEFVKSLARITGDAVAGLFRGWKEQEPKHSVVGIYPR